LLALAGPPASDGASQEPWTRMIARDASGVGFYDGEDGEWLQRTRALRVPSWRARAVPC
jgi:hypothetical protein